MATPMQTLTESFRDLLRDPRVPRRGNPILLGAIAIGLVGILFLASIALPRILDSVRTTTYAAEFHNAGGLRVGDPVHVAGVPAGSVTGLEVDGDVAVVSFSVESDQHVGDRSRAIIGLSSILGNRFLGLDPAGADELPPGERIGVDRTTSAYLLDDIGAEFTGLSEELDVEAVSDMLDSLERVLPQDPEAGGRALDDVTGALGVLTEEDERMTTLLRTTRRVTGLLVEQEQELTALRSNAGVVVSVLAQRRDLLSRLATSLEELADRAASLLTDESETVDRLVVNLRSVAETYQRNSDVLDETMTRMPPALRAVSDATGNGPWTDVSTPTGPIPDSALCSWGVMTECR